MASAPLARLSIVLMMLPLYQPPALAQTAPSAPSPAGSSEDGIYCRPPQARNDSRLLGPKICKPIREWNALHAAGFDVDANGVVKPLQGMKDLNNLSH